METQSHWSLCGIWITWAGHLNNLWQSWSLQIHEQLLTLSEQHCRKPTLSFVKYFVKQLVISCLFQSHLTIAQSHVGACPDSWLNIYTMTAWRGLSFKEQWKCKQIQEINVKNAHMRSGLCLWMMAQKANPSLKDEDMFLMSTSG